MSGTAGKPQGPLAGPYSPSISRTGQEAVQNLLELLMMKMTVKVAKSCLTLSDLMDYTVPGILQARILEWVAVSFSRASSQPMGSNPGLPHRTQIVYQLGHQGSLMMKLWLI